tara:strand:+ start:10367 stop:11056 length:690 start_codon:yes stop_codon:yes gene_type:complete
MPTFPGFPKTTRKFLRQLEANNDREWFQEHKDEYETHVVAPCLAFIESMATPLRSISSAFLATPKKSGGSLMRIHRDTRFSKDKAPYKTNIGIQFRHAEGKDVHAPGFYVHIEANEVFLGAGMWHPDSKPLAAIRQRIATDAPAWKRVTQAAAFQKLLALEGDALKRPPRGMDPDHPLIEDLKRKDFMAVRRFDPKAVEDSSFTKEVLATFKASKNFMGFLCDSLGIAF